jgi:hypothetical protein
MVLVSDAHARVSRLSLVYDGKLTTTRRHFPDHFDIRRCLTILYRDRSGPVLRGFEAKRYNLFLEIGTTKPIVGGSLASGPDGRDGVVLIVKHIDKGEDNRSVRFNVPKSKVDGPIFAPC